MALRTDPAVVSQIASVVLYSSCFNFGLSIFITNFALSEYVDAVIPLVTMIDINLKYSSFVL